jgi:ATP-dependent Lon protease
MEIIEVNGYTLEEKVEIAARHLIPKQIKEHGIQKDQILFKRPILKQIIEEYTNESGVRGLDKVIAKLVRNRTRQIAMEESYELTLTSDILFDVLGAGRSKIKNIDHKTLGVVTGLAWTSIGGDVLFIESSITKGKGKLTLTGNLGDVMKESAIIALEYLKAHADTIALTQTEFDTHNVHIHVPEGATPKDGPSAGITMLTSLASIFAKKKVKKNLAMTGEITLRGDVLPVGGIKEKILAAKRSGVKDIILCHKNKQDIDEIKASYLKGLKFHYVKRMSEVLDIALI